MHIKQRECLNLGDVIISEHVSSTLIAIRYGQLNPGNGIVFDVHVVVGSSEDYVGLIGPIGLTAAAPPGDAHGVLEIVEEIMIDYPKAIINLDGCTWD